MTRDIRHLTPLATFKLNRTKKKKKTPPKKSEKIIAEKKVDLLTNETNIEKRNNKNNATIVYGGMKRETDISFKSHEIY